MTSAGAAWAFVGLALHEGSPTWAFLVAAVVVLALLVAALSRFPAIARSPVAEVSEEQAEANARRGRRVGIWFGVTFTAEAVLMGASGALLGRSGRPLLAPIAVAAIFGLHLLPLAKVLGMRVYTVTGWVIAGCAALSLAIADDHARIFDLAMVVAVVLWICAGRILVRYATPREEAAASQAGGSGATAGTPSRF